MVIWCMKILGAVVVNERGHDDKMVSYGLTYPDTSED